MIPQSTIDAWSRAYAEGNYGAYNDVFPYVNWWDELITGGFTQNYNINIRGGTDYMKYFASAGYQGDGDIYDLKKNDDFDPRHTYKRYNWRSNFDFNFTKSTKLSINIGKHIVVSSIVAFCIGSAPCINGRLWYQLVPTGIVGHCHVIGLHGSNVISKLHACGR